MTAETPFDCYCRLLVDSTPDLDPDELKPDSRLDDLGVDSLALLQLIVQLEEAFELSMPDEAWPETFESVESLWLVVSGLLEHASSVVPSQLCDTS